MRKQDLLHCPIFWVLVHDLNCLSCYLDTCVGGHIVVNMAAAAQGLPRLCREA